VTPAYVDPTVARGGAPGPASDVFGVAAAAFHALTGVPPWNAATPADTLEVAAVGEIPDLAELAPGAPAGLIEVIRRGLSADPHNRGSAAAFALDLRHACRPEPVRLPAIGIPDGELGATGRGLRTELTHQVPGRRPRPAPAIVEPLGRRELYWAAVREWLAVSARPAARRLAVVGPVLVALTVAGWLGLRWTGGGDDGPTVTASPAAATADARSAGSAPLGTSPVAPRLADVPEAPETAEGWRDVVADLYQRRAAAFGTASADLLADVYTPGSSQRAADEEHSRSLAEAGEVLRGFAPAVVEVTAVHQDGDRVTLDLVDRWPDYEVVPAATREGPALRTVAGRADAAARLVLTRTSDGWRIDVAERRG
jgi:hypothetical protein